MKLKIYIFKTTTVLVLFIFVTMSLQAQDYNKELIALNNYLSYINKKSGYGGYGGKDSVWIAYESIYRSCPVYRKEYYSMKIADIENGETFSRKNEFRINCKEGKNCVYYSRVTEFTPYMFFRRGNIDSISTLFTNLINAYYGHKAPVAKVQEYDTITTITNVLSIEDALKNLNAFLPTIYYGDKYSGLEIKDGYLISHFYNKKFEKAKISDLKNISFSNYFDEGKTGNGWIEWFCEVGNCVFSTDFNSNKPSLFFKTKTEPEAEKLKILLDDLAVALGVRNNSKSNYNVKKTTYIPKSEKKENNKTIAKNPLMEINNFLKQHIIKLKSVEIKDNKLFFNYRVGIRTESQSISLSDFVNHVKIEETSVFSLKEIRLICTTEAKPFFSSLTNTYSKYITASQKTDEINSQIKKLLTDLQSQQK